MENIILIGTILGIHVLAWLAPGPLFVLIMRNSLMYSRKTGVWTAAGIAVGNLLHISYSVAAVTLLVATSDVVLTVLKLTGAGYLAYLGVKTVVAKSSTVTSEATGERGDITPLAAFKTGFLTNFLNPNASLFFASIFATLISSNAPFWVVGILWIVMPLNSSISASVLSVFFTYPAVKTVYARYERIANFVLGGALVLLALMIVFRN